MNERGKKKTRMGRREEGSFDYEKLATLLLYMRAI
jgi:hypothetical protein